MSEQGARNSLALLVDQLSNLMAEVDKIYRKAGSPRPTIRDIQRVGEEENLNNICSIGGKVWIQSLPYAKEICAANIILEREIRAAYAMDGIVRAGQAGAAEVAESVITGIPKTPENYYPSGHLRGILSALKYVLEREPL